MECGQQRSSLDPPIGSGGGGLPPDPFVWPGGETFVIAGQSNAVGQTTTLSAYTFLGVPAGLYRKPDNVWVNLADPTDNNSGNRGSAWPMMANAYIAERALPIGIIPAAVSGSSITSWLPGTTNYNAMLARVASAGVAPLGVLWWQGETDAQSGMSQATYHGHLATIAAQIQTDLGAPLFVAKLQNCTGISAGNLSAIQAAQQAAWSDIGNVRQGPDLSDIATDDGLHLVAEAKMATAAARWYAALKAEFGW